MVDAFTNEYLYKKDPLDKDRLNEEDRSIEYKVSEQIASDGELLILWPDIVEKIKDWKDSGIPMIDKRDLTAESLTWKVGDEINLFISSLKGLLPQLVLVTDNLEAINQAIDFLETYGGTTELQQIAAKSDNPIVVNSALSALGRLGVTKKPKQVTPSSIDDRQRDRVLADVINQIDEKLDQIWLSPDTLEKLENAKRFTGKNPIEDPIAGLVKHEEKFKVTFQTIVDMVRPDSAEPREGSTEEEVIREATQFIESDQIRKVIKKDHPLVEEKLKQYKSDNQPEKARRLLRRVSTGRLLVAPLDKGHSAYVKGYMLISNID
ncbi:hypothetical protein ES705_46277 [subsurface metagenome]